MAEKFPTIMIKTHKKTTFQKFVKKITNIMRLILRLVAFVNSKVGKQDVVESVGGTYRN